MNKKSEDAIEVKLGRGSAQSVTTIKGRRMSYTGVWSISINDEKNEKYYSVDCMVPGELNMFSSGMAAMNWPESDYVISISAIADDEYIKIDTSLIKEIKKVLQRVKDGEVKAKHHYGNEVDGDRIQEIVSFLLPRLDFVPQNLQGGVATKSKIEAAMNATEIPPLSRV